METLSEDVKEYQKHEKQVDFNNFDEIQTTTDAYDSSWWYGFTGLLVTLPYPKDSCRKLVEFLQVYYEENEVQLGVLSDFEANYTSNKAAWWYTRSTCLYILLNKILRQHNIEMAFLFGFFIQDLYRQLKTEFEIFKLTHLEHHSFVKSYRGQTMHIDEIKKFTIMVIVL